MNLFALPGTFTICRFAPGTGAWQHLDSSDSPFISITRTNDELSVVCPSEIVPNACEQRSDGWRCIGVQGPLDFSLTGILSSLLSPLAAAKISVFTVATFDTDYLLVRADALERAIEALAADGHIVSRR